MSRAVLSSRCVLNYRYVGRQGRDAPRPGRADGRELEVSSHPSARTPHPRPRHPLDSFASAPTAIPAWLLTCRSRDRICDWSVSRVEPCCCRSSSLNLSSRPSWFAPSASASHPRLLGDLASRDSYPVRTQRSNSVYPAAEDAQLSMANGRMWATEDGRAHLPPSLSLLITVRPPSQHQPALHPTR